MGDDTHFFAYDPNEPSFIGAWTQMVDDARAIGGYVEATLGMALAGRDGCDVPEFTERRIFLNGTAHDGLHLENLMIDSQPWRRWDELAAEGETAAADALSTQFRRDGFVWAFCNTGRKPYDVAVRAILLRCSHLAPGSFVIESDGDSEHEWLHAVCCWRGHRLPGSAPVEVVRTLFGQLTIPGGLFTDTLRGPACALPKDAEAH
jgi:hypothetical protein